jgi:hypothetical protein
MTGTEWFALVLGLTVIATGVALGWALSRH